MRYCPPVVVSIFLLMSSAHAQAPAPCAVSDQQCLMTQQENIAATIETVSWRDQTYRELAKSYTYAGMEDRAIALIAKIETPDTKAMTIRGIGMAAGRDWDKARLDKLWENLGAQAKLIDHEPSRAIAWTYIAMSQAFAGDDGAAYATAGAMENAALRHKAFAETAEIQAERGDLANVEKSIAAIDTASFRNKAYRTASKIFLGRGNPQAAYQLALKIDNPYQQADAIQHILNLGNPEEDGSLLEKKRTTP